MDYQNARRYRNPVGRGGRLLDLTASFYLPDF